jgi:flavin-dependent dehydrogenase
MQHNSQSNRRQAIVIGASVAGLLAARVLSDFYQHVLVLERDDLSIEGNLGVACLTGGTHMPC